MLDGVGYPLGLAVDALPMEAWMITVAESYNALVARCCYHEPWTLEAAIERPERAAAG